MAYKPWWAQTLAAQLLQITNFQAKAPKYAASLGFTMAEVDAICDAFTGAVNSAEECKRTMQAMTQWRDEVLYGKETGQAVEQAPVFPVVGTTDYTQGVVKQFHELRDRIVSSPNYTIAIGEDLGLVGAVITAKPADEVQPVIKSVQASGVSVQIRGSMQGMDALRVEYAPNGGAFRPVGFLTSMPGTISITDGAETGPQNGRVRAVYVRKNADYGNYSPEFPVTIA